MNERRPKYSIAIRAVDMARPLEALTDVADYSRVRVFVSLNDRPVGRVDIANHYEIISAARLRDAILEKYTVTLSKILLARHYGPDEPEESPEELPPHIKVSIVVATYDRPDDLRNCLRCLASQVSPRSVEIIVVDNNSGSGLTAPVVAEFPGVVLVTEERKGLSYARNKGIITSRGDIVVTTDDDVTMPPDWLKKLVRPFVRSNIMIVTGNVLPVELETRAQVLFEAYGGLGRGFETRVVDGNWFNQFRTAVRTWELGATANAAFRASIFDHPDIGLMDEALGAGTPTGCSEDTYLFYKVLKAGFALVYEPSAYVWHRHRRDEAALRRQIYNYSKGHVAYQLATCMRDGDKRALLRLFIGLPETYLRRMKQRLLGKSEYPSSLILLEALGNLAGPWALWRSRRRVKRLGRSGPYLPVANRFPADTPPPAGERASRIEETIFSER